MVIVKNTDRYFVDRGWMKGYRCFSFQDYYDEYNDHFGNLIVLNDEEFMPRRGFGMHPTENIEILTYVVSGELEVGNQMLKEKLSIKEGEFQLLSAGKGVMHSEINKLSDRPCAFIQFWFTPSEYDREPFYCRITPSEEELKNQLFLLFSGERQAPGKIGQDVNFYMMVLDEGQEICFTPKKGRGTLIFVVSGELRVGDTLLQDRDCLRTTSMQGMKIRSEKETKFFLVDTK